MPILCQDIVTICNAELDSEGSERYIWDRDYKYALTAANNYLVSIFNEAFASNKLSEESLKELTFCRVWQLSNFSRFAFDSTDVGNSLWTILAIYPKITYIDAGVVKAQTATPLYTPTSESLYLDKLSFRDSNYSCKRLTAEEWAMRNRNMFMAGSELITCDDLKEYAYIDYANYTNGYSLVNDKFEIEISPKIGGELIAMRYLSIPVAPTVIGDSLQFPNSLLNLAVQLVLRFIGIKDGVLPAYQVAQSEVAQLTKMLS